MSSISAGTTSTTTLVHSGDTTGSLVFKTNDTGSGGTTAVTIDTSQRAAFVAGTAALPAITTSGDTNTGIYFPAADTIAFAEGGTEAMRIDSSGNVGIGTTSPAGKLHVSTSSASAANLILNSSNNTPYMRFDQSDASKFTIGESSIVGGGGAGYYDFYAGASVGQRFFTGAAERMRIDSSGNLYVGQTSGDYVNSNSLKLASATNTGYLLVNHINGSSSGNVFVGFGYNGGAIGNITQNGTTAVAYNTSSDYRLKENIAPLTGALNKVAQLKPVTYTWKASPEETGEGFIAHELAEVCPQAVHGTKDEVDAEGNPKYQGIDTSFLVATLTAALQETKALIDQQAETINAQSEAIASLTARVVALESRGTV